MNRRLPLLLLGLLLAAAGPAVAGPQINAKQLKRTQDRITSLYRNHDQPAPAPGERGNPFRVGGDLPAPTQPGQPVDAASDAAARDVLLLRQAAATIKVTGVVNIAKRLHIAINQSTYREGAVIPVQLPGEMVFLRVAAITPKSVTLRLHEAEQTLKF